VQYISFAVFSYYITGGRQSALC